jgi:hypothetical protein
MMKSPKDKCLFSSEQKIDDVLYNDVPNKVPTKPVHSSKQQNLRISTATTATSTSTMQQYFERRLQQQILQKKKASTIRPQNPIMTADMSQFSLSPLACRITSTIEQAILNYKSEQLRCASISSKKIRQPKKVVRFATNQNVTIRYDLDTNVLSKKASTAMFWYTVQDYAKFRTESNDIAAYAAGDLDYQQFFMNTLYPYCCHMAKKGFRSGNDTTNNMGKNIIMPVSPTDSDSDSTISTCSSGSNSTAPMDTDSCGSSTCSNSSSVSSSVVIDMTNNDDVLDVAELEMMSKYRGLERIIFRHILQDLKIQYIKRCVKEEAEKCYFDSDESDMDLEDGTTTSCDIRMTESTDSSTTETSFPSNFRQSLFTSQIMAQFNGQVDRVVVVQDNQEYFLEQQKLQLERLKLAKAQKKKRRNKAKGDTSRRKSHQNEDICDYENFHQQTIEI